jgi:hypothetical protein
MKKAMGFFYEFAGGLLLGTFYISLVGGFSSWVSPCYRFLCLFTWVLIDRSSCSATIDRELQKFYIKRLTSLRLFENRLYQTPILQPLLLLSRLPPLLPRTRMTLPRTKPPTRHTTHRMKPYCPKHTNLSLLK